MEKSLHEYTVTPGQVDTSGIEYEIKMTTLLYLRALREGYKFLLATGVKAAGKFDDVVLEYDDGTEIKTILIQLKHKKRKSIKYSDLLSSKSNNDFCLIKYYNSYSDIKKNFLEKREIQWNGKFENFKFVLCTNAKLNSTCIQIKPDTSDERILLAGGAVLSLAGNVKLKEEMIEKYGDTTDFTYIDEFMNQTVLIVKQSSHNKLDTVLKEEISNIYKLSERGTNRVLSELMIKIHYWWQDKEVTRVALKEHSFLFQSSSEILVKVNKRMKNVENIDVKFKDEVVSQVQQIFFSQDKLINIAVENSSVQLACLKLFQSALNTSEPIIFVEFKMLHNAETWNNILHIWPSSWYKYLIIKKEYNYIIEHHDMINVFQKLKEVMENVKESKIIFVSASSDQLQELLNIRTIGEQIRIMPTSNELNEFTQESAREILSRNVNFQGFLVPLKEIIKDTYYSLSTNLLSVLIRDDESVVIGNSLSSEQGFFISRTLKINNCIKSSVLFSIPTDVIAVSGVEMDKLNEFLQKYKKGKTVNYQVMNKRKEDGNWLYRKMEQGINALVCTSHNEEVEERLSDEDYISNIKLIKTHEEYNKLCEEKLNVHWLEMKNEILHWKQSHGDISVIQNNIDDGYSEYCVNSVWDIPNQLVLITAECGMGKSTLVRQVAKYTKQQSPATCVIKIHLNDCTRFLASLDGKQISHTEVKDFLLQSQDFDHSNSYEREIFLHLLDQPEKCVILIDSFDEIVPRYENTVLSLLTEIKKIRFSKLWVTSRITYSHTLEQHLNVLSFSIKPFTEHEQSEFFAEYWNTERNKLDVNMSSPYAKRIISITEKETVFGIPLYCHMIAEVYRDCFFNNMLNNIDITNFNLTSLCEEFVEKTFSAYCKKYNIDTQDTKTEMGEMIRARKDQFYQNHMNASLLLFLTPKEINKVKNLQELSKYLENICFEEKAGLITSVKDGRPNFIHSIFVEYFVARFIAENISLCKKLIGYMYKDKRFNTITKFVDLLLLDTDSLHRSVIRGNIKSVQEKLELSENEIHKTDIFGRTALHLAVSYYRTSINDFPNCEPEIIKLLLQHGAKVNVFDKVCKHTPFYGACLSSYKWKILPVMYEYGNISKSQTKTLKKLVKKETNYREIYQIFDTCYFKFGKFFIKHAKYLDSLKFDLISKAAEKGNLKVLEFLLAEDIFMWDNDDKSQILYTATQRGHTNIIDYLTSVHHLNQYAVLGGQLLTRSRSRYLNIAERVELIKHYEETMNLNMDLVYSRCGDDSLFIVDNLKCVKYLVEVCHMNPTIPDRYGRLPIHVMSAIDQVDIVQYYLDKCNISGDIADKNGNSPLHHACMGPWNVNINVVKLLVGKYNADVNLKNKRGSTPFLVAASQPGCAETMRYLFENGADIFAYEDNGNTALHCSTYFGDIDTMKYLIEECKMDPHIQNHKGETALDLLMLKNDSNVLISENSLLYLQQKTT